MNVVERQPVQLARNVRRLGHLDLPGAGQVTVAGRHAYVGHIPNKNHLGTSIIDIADPGNPRVVATITLDDHTSHSHKARVAGDIMIVNHERYAYISTEMQGYIGNILVIYDIADPHRPAEVGRWWMPGQHIAGGETPSWPGRQHRLHHALRFGSEMWASCWHGGFFIVDVSDLSSPKSVGSYNYHPLFPEPTHTVMPVKDKIKCRCIALALDVEDQAMSEEEDAVR